MIFETVKNQVKYTFDREYSIEDLEASTDLTTLEGFIKQEPFILVGSIEIDPETRLKNDKAIGQIIIDQFLLILKPQTISVSQSVGLMQKFAGIQTLLSLGAVKEASVLLYTVEVDSIFTQEIKASFINQMTEYLSQHN